MCHIYPRFFPDDSKSYGERRVYEILKEQAPEDWYVIHSFRLKSHQRVVFGEADFIVAAPDYGVFVLEIKSGGVGFDGSYWYYINRFGEKTVKQRGPFEQAYEAMFEVKKYIRSKYGDKYSDKNVLFGYGVIFTDTNSFPESSITEDQQWRLYQDTVKRDYVSFIKSLAINFRRELQSLGKKVPEKLLPEDAKEIISEMRPVVECVPPLKSFIHQSEKEIIHLTNEQYDCIDDIDLNDRISIEGGAGTGKTLIAVEYARRQASEGKSILFLCYNKCLADYIRLNLADSRITVKSFFSFLYEVSQKTGINYEINDKFHISSDYLSLILQNISTHYMFDLLLVDEFQDLCVNQYLDIFNKVLRGGLRDGRFVFFGDFSHQAIFNQNSTLHNLSNRTSFARKKLSINCRNTKNIGNEVINVSGFTDTSYKLKIAGEKVDFYPYKDLDDEQELIKKCLSGLRKHGIESSNIMILSPLKREKSVIGKLDPDKNIIGNYGDNSSDYYALFSSVQGFKGLESPVVIITDISSYNNKQLMYVAFSRAKDKLIVLESNDAYKQRTNIIIGRG